MLAKVFSSTVFGIDAHAVEVEVDISSGLPALSMVGLPDTACRESMDRVRSALKNSGIAFPAKKITVNLAPANLKKEGSAFDLPIALGILAANENIPMSALVNMNFCAELSLDGRLKPVSGILPRAAKMAEFGHSLLVADSNEREALCVEGVCVYSASTLREVILHLRQEKSLDKKIGEAFCLDESQIREGSDFSEIRGQMLAKRALEIAAAGKHNVLMMGPPGSGKTMLAKRLPGILSSLTAAEAIESTKIHSISGRLSKQMRMICERPFRDPHHTVSAAAMVGGGTHPKPGEVSLAHHGVLFLDELAEFRRAVLEVLRQPLEEGRVSISRAAYTMTFPSRFMLVAAMNPCPCGYFTDRKKECSCSSVQIRNYLAKISGPLLDRMDIQLHVPRLSSEEIIDKKFSSEPSALIRERVEKAQKIQERRFAGTSILSNAYMGIKDIDKYCQVPVDAEVLLKQAVSELGFSARAYHKCLKVARTVADLEQKDRIEKAHVAEAIHYRALDKAANEI